MVLTHPLTYQLWHSAKKYVCVCVCVYGYMCVWSVKGHNTERTSGAANIPPTDLPAQQIWMSLLCLFASSSLLFSLHLNVTSPASLGDAGIFCMRLRGFFSCTENSSVLSLCVGINSSCVVLCGFALSQRGETGSPLWGEEVEVRRDQVAARDVSVDVNVALTVMI